MEEVAEVVEEMEGPGVVGGDDGIGGGVTDCDRCMVEMWMFGRACQKEEVETRGTGVLLFTAEGIAVMVLEEDDDDAMGGCGLSVAFATGLGRVFSFSRSFLSFFLTRRISSSFSAILYDGTPFRSEVNTSRDGRESKLPARTVVAVRRCLL